MSEYQYYEFQAIDRRLTAGEMAELRAVSTRARITPTSFVNEYDWGDFKGDVEAWMDEYFDAFLYFANWGTRTLKLRLPATLLDEKTASRYCSAESAFVAERNGKTILTFASQDDDAAEWEDETDALSALIPIRAQLARGDLRSLYIGWLCCAQAGELEDEESEPPVPPGLGDLDGSLARLVDFLRVDNDLFEVAAAASPALQAQTLTQEAIRQWIAGCSRAEKDSYLERFIVAEEPALAAELQRLIGKRHIASPTPSARTAGSLLRAAEALGDERRREAAARAERERARREHEAALARAKYLEDLAQREPAAWKQIQDLIATKQPANYDRAVALLVDLRDVTTAQGRESNFQNQLSELRTEHARKPSFLSKLDRAMLGNRIR